MLPSFWPVRQNARDALSRAFMLPKLLTRSAAWRPLTTLSPAPRRRGDNIEITPP
jgi:hypothetical protein